MFDQVVRSGAYSFTRWHFLVHHVSELKWALRLSGPMKSDPSANDDTFPALASSVGVMIFLFLSAPQQFNAWTL